MSTYTSTGPGGDVLLFNVMPEAEYMYGCTPTATAMVLGYYDLYGYHGTNLSNMIEGVVDQKSRGTDGNAYDMDAFDTVLGRATATSNYVYRFYARDGVPTTPGQELEYTFVGDTSTLNTGVWDCLADYLGTGQYWRGNGNLSTSISYGTLEDLLTKRYTNYQISDGVNTRIVTYRDTTMMYGLYLYVQARGYAMDLEISGTYEVDSAGGDFTFEDYMREIDSGRPVLISIEGHSMAGYGYNASTREIIFDDCYRSGQRMTWGGTYNYSGADRALQSITVIGININGDVDLALVNTADSEEKVILAGTTGALATNDYCFAGTTVYLTYSIRNTGSRESGDFYTAVRVDGNLVSSSSVYSLSAQSTRKNQNISLGQLAVGMHRVRVTVDENNDIQELSGLNNTEEGSILILKSGTSIVSGYKTVSNATVRDTYVQGGGTMILSSGQAFDTILRGKITSVSDDGTVWFYNGKANVQKSGFLSGTNVYDYGAVVVSSGGTAVNTNVFSNGYTSVFNGGILSNTTVDSDGRVRVYSGGKVTGLFHAADGASATFYDGSILDFDLSSVSPGAGARVTGFSGFEGIPTYILTVSGSQKNGEYTLAEDVDYFNETITVKNTLGESLGALFVGQTANIGGAEYTLTLNGSTLSVTVTGGGGDIFTGDLIGETKDISDGMFASSVNVKTNGRLNILSGGSAEQTTVNSGGSMYVSSGGIAIFTTVNSFGSMTVSSGGTAYDTKVNSGGWFYVSSGGIANNTTLNNGAFEVTGGVANKVTVNSFGVVDVLSNGVINGITVNSGGSVRIGADLNAGGTANSITVNSGGSLRISSGGTATEIVENGGYVDVAAGANVTFRQNSFNGLVLSNASATVHSGTTADSTTISFESFLDVSSGGTATDTTVISNGWLSVSSGGTAIFTTVNSFGSMTVSSGGTAYITTVKSRGSMFVSSGGTAYGTTVNSGGWMGVLSGGKAVEIIENGGYVYVADGAIAVFSSNSFSGVVLSNAFATVHSRTTANSTTISFESFLDVSSGGIANSTTVISNGWLSVSSGGTANITTITSNGGFSVSSGGIANITTINSRGSMFVSSGGKATDTTVNSGYLYVSSGGTANSTTVNSRGSMFVSSGGTVTGIVENGGYVKVLEGASAAFASNSFSGVVLSNASATVHSGTTANITTVSSRGYLYVFSGGTAYGTTVDSGGSMFISSGGTATGKMSFSSGAVVSMCEGAIVDFSLAQTEAGAEALVNDLSIIQGVPLYTLTVDGTQSFGYYILADGAAGFNKTISVQNSLGESLGTLAVGGTLLVDGIEYALNLNNGTLSVTVGEPVPPTPGWTFFTGDFNGDLFDTLAVQSGNVITVYMNGEPWGLCITLDPGWTTVGVGDFSGDGLDDFLRVNTEGYVVGEMSNGNGTFSPQVLNLKNAGWDILGTGDFNGSGSCDVLVANPTGASETVGLLGYWESGVTWTLINGYSPEWECVSTGDFNGDGKCDMLWRNSFEGEGGLTYNAYCTWIVDDPVDWRMVSVANPDEWDFLCSGDFDGNGSHDIAMINDVGVVGIWGVNDGYLNSWSILSAVNPAEWTLAGVADFNGDGTDDIAWCNTETGLAGYWQINDKQLTTWTNIATIG